MTKKNKIVFGVVSLWGVSNVAAYHLLKRRLSKHIEGLNTQIDNLLEIGTKLAGELPMEKLNSALRNAPYDAEFNARLNSM